MLSLNDIIRLNDNLRLTVSLGLGYPFQVGYHHTNDMICGMCPPVLCIDHSLGIILNVAIKCDLIVYGIVIPEPLSRDT